jgi:CheY-like chemotaxis protein
MLPNSNQNGKSRILVVDDDLRLRDLLQRYLGEQGFGVATVSDAAGMDRLLARERFDLLVLDLMLPGEDGLSICRRLRGTKNNIPIVMLTAKGEDVDRIVGLEMAPTITCRNRSTRANWWHASMQYCAAGPRRPRPALRRWNSSRSASAPSRSTWPIARWKRVAK